MHTMLCLYIPEKGYLPIMINFGAGKRLFMNASEILFFSGFLVLIFFMLMLDLGVFRREIHKVGFAEALLWSGIWIAVSIAFYVFLIFYGNKIHGVETMDAILERIQRYSHPIAIQGLTLQEALHVYNHNLALEYLTGYVIEKSLSADNIFVMILIFQSFGVKEIYYKKVLIWGILGAVVMRFIFIFVGAALVHEFHWILYLFGIFLIATAVTLFMKRKRKQRIEPANHPVVRFMSKYFRVAKYDRDGKFFIRENGRLFITPLFIVVIVIEFSDVIFAVDSIPAIFAISQDPYIIFYSNVFAILGLRALFFLLVNLMTRFHYLKIGLSLILLAIGLKMIIPDLIYLITDDHFKIPTSYSLYFILAVLFLSIMASVIRPPKNRDTGQ